MSARKKLSRALARKIFKRAAKVNGRNRIKLIMRGGTRL